MESTRDLRNVILLLVQANIQWRARATASNASLARVFQAIESQPMALKPAQIQSELAPTAKLLEAQFASQASQVIESLQSDDRDFLESLRWYASRQLSE
jgi:hypothetical protein